MKNTIIYLLGILIICSGSSKAQINDFKKFLAEFSYSNLPFNTISTSSIQEQIRLRKKIIPKDLCVKFLLGNDESKAWYSSEVFDFETGKVIGKDRQLYDFNSISYSEMKPFYLFFYQKSSDEDATKCFMSVFDISGKLKGEILVGEISRDYELNKFVKSLISEDQKIEIDMYEAIPINDSKSRYDTILSRTVVTHLSYKINLKIGSIEFVDSVRQFSKCGVDDFFANESKCKISKFK